jgi:hypothetical protein
VSLGNSDNRISRNRETTMTQDHCLASPHHFNRYSYLRRA